LFSEQSNIHKITDSGLVISPQWQFIAASPDGVVNCSCHEKGVLETECPFTGMNALQKLTIKK